MRLSQGGGQIGWNPHFSVRAVVIRHRPYWAPPSGTATLRDKFPGKYFPSFIPPGFATTSNLYTTASLLTLRVPNLACFFQPELLIPESTLSYIQGSCYLSQIGPLTREFTSHKIRAYNKETSADPAVAQKRSRLSKSCCTACGVTICNEGAECPYSAEA